VYLGPSIVTTGGAKLVLFPWQRGLLPMAMLPPSPVAVLGFEGGRGHRGAIHGPSALAAVQSDGDGEGSILHLAMLPMLLRLGPSLPCLRGMPVGSSHWPRGHDIDTQVEG
jgi:hypothetical protein